MPNTKQLFAPRAGNNDYRLDCTLCSMLDFQVHLAIAVIFTQMRYVHSAQVRGISSELMSQRVQHPELLLVKGHTLVAGVELAPKAENFRGTDYRKESASIHTLDSYDISSLGRTPTFYTVALVPRKIPGKIP